MIIPRINKKNTKKRKKAGILLGQCLFYETNPMILTFRVVKSQVKVGLML